MIIGVNVEIFNSGSVLGMGFASLDSQMIGNNISEIYYLFCPLLLSLLPLDDVICGSFPTVQGGVRVFGTQDHTVYSCSIS